MYLTIFCFVAKLKLLEFVYLLLCHVSFLHQLVDNSISKNINKQY